jgi:cell division protein FtsL
MLLRLLHIVVLAGLVLAAADVYKIKYESTLEAEKVAKLRDAVRHEQDQIAKLRAEWARLDRPERIQALAQRHLSLKQLDATQYDRLDHLPERRPDLVPPDSADPIGALVDTINDADAPTGSVPGEGAKPR